MKKSKKNPHIKFIGSILTASLIVFGTASCNQSSEPGEFEGPYDGPIEEGFAGEDGYTTAEPLANTQVYYFNAWDDNKDRQWDKQEFSAGLAKTGLYNEWDANRDKSLSEDEFNRGLLNEWDEDGNGYLSSEEYGIGNGAWEDDFGNNFEAWDTNDDSIVDSEEFNAGIASTGLYNNWDTNKDAVFSEEEFYNGLHASWDNDNSGYIDEGEFGKAEFSNWYK